jgi:CDP-diacylglycerol--glycerol-3-phosphate 3-phosphatidyltransferase
MNRAYRHLPNFLTLARIALIPFFMIAFYLPWPHAHLLAALLFIVAALTDWFDGYLARHFQVTSALGAFLDPDADKLLVSTALVLLVASPLEYLSIPAVIIIGREIAISALREWMAELGKRHSIAANLLGKTKTTVQMIAIVMLILVKPDTAPWFMSLSYFFMYLAAVLTIWTMCIYCLTAWRVMR